MMSVTGDYFISSFLIFLPSPPLLLALLLWLDAYIVLLLNLYKIDIITSIVSDE